MGATMVCSGMAWAFTKYNVDCLSREVEAKTAGRCMHRHECGLPGDDRQRMREHKP